MRLLDLSELNLWPKASATNVRRALRIFKPNSYCVFMVFMRFHAALSNVLRLGLRALRCVILATFSCLIRMRMRMRIRSLEEMMMMMMILFNVWRGQ